MIPPDQEIYEVERRIALRRSQVVRHSKEAGRRTLQALASPAALIGAAALGFFVAAKIAKREQKPKHPERRKSDHTKAAKATGLAGILLPAAMWFVKAQWGSPVAAAQAVLQKWQGRKTAPSLPPDMPRTTVRRDAERIARP
jgi:hypothetical protein